MRTCEDQKCQETGKQPSHYPKERALLGVNVTVRTIGDLGGGPAVPFAMSAKEDTIKDPKALRNPWWILNGRKADPPLKG